MTSKQFADFPVHLDAHILDGYITAAARAWPQSIQVLASWQADDLHLFNTLSAIAGCSSQDADSAGHGATQQTTKQRSEAAFRAAEAMRDPSSDVFYTHLASSSSASGGESDPEWHPHIGRISFLRPPPATGSNPPEPPRITTSCGSSGAAKRRARKKKQEVKATHEYQATPDYELVPSATPLTDSAVYHSMMPPESITSPARQYIPRIIPPPANSSTPAHDRSRSPVHTTPTGRASTKSPLSTDKHDTLARNQRRDLSKAKRRLQGVANLTDAIDADVVEQRQPSYSRGASLHAEGKCIPCRWFWKPQPCKYGSDCNLCHLCPSGESAARRARLQIRNALDHDLLENAVSRIATAKVKPPTSVTADSIRDLIPQQRGTLLAALTSTYTDAIAPEPDQLDKSLEAFDPQGGLPLMIGSSSGTADSQPLGNEVQQSQDEALGYIQPGVDDLDDEGSEDECIDEDERNDEEPDLPFQVEEWTPLATALPRYRKVRQIPKEAKAEILLATTGPGHCFEGRAFLQTSNFYRSLTTEDPKPLIVYVKKSRRWSIGCSRGKTHRSAQVPIGTSPALAGPWQKQVSGTWAQDELFFTGYKHHELPSVLIWTALPQFTDPVFQCLHTAHFLSATTCKIDAIAATAASISSFIRRLRGADEGLFAQGLGAAAERIIKAENHLNALSRTSAVSGPAQEQAYEQISAALKPQLARVQQAIRQVEPQNQVTVYNSRRKWPEQAAREKLQLTSERYRAAHEHARMLIDEARSSILQYNAL